MSQWLDRLSALMPNLVDYIVYAAIAIVTLIGVFKCLIPLWRTTHSLREAIKQLQKHAGEKATRPVWQERAFVGKRLQGSWIRFLQNAEQLDRRQLPCNVEDYINDDTVTHGPGNATLAELIPSLLTSLGILGTFMGMTRGLSGLDVSTTDAMMKGIQTLLNGMRFAFGTSVAGVSCSIIFNMVNRIAQGSSYRAIDDFTEAFTTLAMQRPLDNDVQLICQNQDRNHLLGEVTDTVSGKMAASIEMAVGRALQPIAVSMDNFLIGATRGQIDGVQHIVDNFIDDMNRSLNGQFLQLGQTLSDLNQREQLSDERLNGMIASMNVVMQDVGRLHGVSESVINRFQQYVTELNGARQRDEGFEQSAADLLSAMRQAQNDMARLMVQMQNSQRTTDASIQTMSGQIRTAAEAIQRADSSNSQQQSAAATSLANAQKELALTCQEYIRESVDGLSAAVSGFKTNVDRLTELLGTQLDGAANGASEGDMTARIGDIQRALTDIRGDLETIIGRTPAEV